MTHIEIIINVSSGIVQQVGCSLPSARVTIVDWDAEGGELGDDVVSVSLPDGDVRSAIIDQRPAYCLRDYVPLTVREALQAAAREDVLLHSPLI